MNDSPYLDIDNKPKMIPSFVCYVDILGYKRISMEAIENDSSLEFLNKLKNALDNAYNRLREHSEFLKHKFYSIKIFTDNIVVGYPLESELEEHGETEFGDIIDIFSEYQVRLAMNGFLVRGGLAFGKHYMDADIVFGDAFLDAATLDVNGSPPRITLTKTAIEKVRIHLSYFGRLDDSPLYEDLRQDVDGAIFLNYLGQAFCAFPDAGVFFEVIEEHRNTVVDGLRTYKGNAGVRAKYEWAARYHNSVINDFLKEYPMPSKPDMDEILATAVTEAHHRLPDYLIDIESLAAAPGRITLEPNHVR